MDFFTAQRYAEARLHIRRSVWVTDVAEPQPGSTNKRVTKWLAYARGIWFIRTTADGISWTTQIVEATHFSRADMMATDWTLMDAEGYGQVVPPDEPDVPGDDVLPDDIIPPIPPTTPPGGGAGGGGAGEGSGGDSGGGGGYASRPVVTDPPPGGGAPGGGGAGEGGGADNGRPPPRPDRSAPALTVTVTRTTEGECVGLLPDGQPNPEAINDTFDVEVNFAADPDARPGEVWWISIWAGGNNPGVKHSGTIVPDADITIPISIDSFAGRQITVKATVYLAHVGVTTQGTGTAVMRPDCVGCIAPVIVGAGYVGGAPDEIGQPFTVQFALVGNDPVVTFTMDGDPYSGSVETAEGIVTFTGTAPATGGYHSLGVHVVGACGSTGITFDMNLT